MYNWIVSLEKLELYRSVHEYITNQFVILFFVLQTPLDIVGKIDTVGSSSEFIENIVETLENIKFQSSANHIHKRDVNEVGCIYVIVNI